MTASDKNEANELWFQSIWGLYEFSPEFTAEGWRTEVEPVNLVIIHIMQHHHMWPFVICYVLLWKLLTAF